MVGSPSVSAPFSLAGSLCLRRDAPGLCGAPGEGLYITLTEAPWPDSVKPVRFISQGDLHTWLSLLGSVTTLRQPGVRGLQGKLTWEAQILRINCVQ